jgi:hypothetical protein
VTRLRRTKRHGEKAPETADLYFSYGKALLENAISQSSVLGKEQPEDGVEGGENKGKLPQHSHYVVVLIHRSFKLWHR